MFGKGMLKSQNSEFIRLPVIPLPIQRFIGAQEN
jgi:hypothetical protein